MEILNQVKHIRNKFQYFLFVYYVFFIYFVSVLYTKSHQLQSIGVI
jgi:hypothetical protein